MNDTTLLHLEIECAYQSPGGLINNADADSIVLRQSPRSAFLSSFKGMLRLLAQRPHLEQLGIKAPEEE